MKKTKRNILIIEDDKTHRKMISWAFKAYEAKNNLNILLAEDLVSATKIIRSETIDLVISDYYLPDGIGTDLLTFSIKHKKFPLVIMTSSGNEQLAVDSMKKGAHDYIVKTTKSFKTFPQKAQKWVEEWRFKMERRTQELELIEQKVKLEETNKELSRIAYSISHDLATPIEGIIKLTKWIEEDIDTENPKVKENLKLLRNRTLRLKYFMQGILDYSKLSNLIEQETVRIIPLLNEIITTTAIPDYVKVAIGNKPCQIRGNQSLVFKLFQNLIENAIRHNDEHPLEVKIEWTEQNDFYIFSICDNGKGIDKRHHERVFKMFQILESRDTNESTGVGLTIAKRIVENADGKIWIESSKGKGACFKFTWSKKPKPS